MGFKEHSLRTRQKKVRKVARFKLRRTSVPKQTPVEEPIPPSEPVARQQDTHTIKEIQAPRGQVSIEEWRPSENQFGEWQQQMQDSFGKYERLRQLHENAHDKSMNRV